MRASLPLLLGLLPLASPFTFLTPAFFSPPSLATRLRASEASGSNIDTRIRTPSTPSPDRDFDPEEMIFNGPEYDAKTLPELQPVSIDAYRLGDSDNQDDPLDAPWRLAALEMLHKASEVVNVKIQDVMWKFSELTLTVPHETTTDQQELLAKAIHKIFDEAMEKQNAMPLEQFYLGADVLLRHELIIQTPGAPDVLTTAKQYEVWKGFEVTVQTKDPFNSNRVLTGKLVSRDAMDLKIKGAQGNVITIPTEMVAEVKLVSKGEEPTNPKKKRK
jgi:ribosome maturation factor RimP